MAKRCKNYWCVVRRIDGRDSVETIYGARHLITRTNAVFWARCRDCKYHLPLLFTSNDGPVEVRIEMLAAEVGQNSEVWRRFMDLDPEIDADIRRIGARNTVSLGATTHDAGHASLDPIPRWFAGGLDDYWAGWLARDVASTEDADAWPWDPSRPVAGQYEESLWVCPVDSNECAIRRRCTNKCGALESTTPVRATAGAAPRKHWCPDHRTHDCDACPSFDVIAGPEPETGVEVAIETGHTCSDRSLDCAACDVADDEERGDPAGCAACGTSDGCEDHRMFMCAACHRIVPWSDGADDEHPNDCSDCWAAKQPTTPEPCTSDIRVRSDDQDPVAEIGGEA